MKTDERQEVDPKLSRNANDAARLQEDLASIDLARRNAWQKARDVWIA